MLRAPKNRKHPMNTRTRSFNIAILCFAPALLFTQCEGNNFAAGYVVDVDTRTPIADVLCSVRETERTTKTNIDGYYHLDGPFGSCFPDCENMTVDFVKVGYQSVAMTNPGKDTVFLAK